MSTLRRSLAAALAAFALAGAAQGQMIAPGAGDDGDGGVGVPMTSEELREVHAGNVTEGCYVGRPEDPHWRELNAEDGRLFDMEKDGAEVGRWWIQKGGIICFVYSDRPPGPYCFTGRRRDDKFDFYSAFGGELVATTDCQDEPIS